MLNKVISVVAVISFCSVSFAGYEKRQNIQNQRIQQGKESGSLTRREAKNLERGQNKVERKAERLENAKADAMADGKVDRQERREIARKRGNLKRTQNKQSRKIRNKKANRRQAR